MAGGIPIIANISQCLSANQIRSIHGDSERHQQFHPHADGSQQGADYAAAVAEAQRLGYAEADPSMDVDGSDAAQKLAILAHLAFGVRPHWRDIPARGIDTLDAADLRYAKELGYRIKLLAVAELGDGGLGAARLADAGPHAARRWPKSAGRTTRSAWWATPWAACFFTAWEPGRCRPPRPSSPI